MERGPMALRTVCVHVLEFLPFTPTCILDTDGTILILSVAFLIPNTLRFNDAPFWEGVTWRSCKKRILRSSFCRLYGSDYHMLLYSCWDWVVLNYIDFRIFR
jgi:hypothetical protein